MRAPTEFRAQTRKRAHDLLEDANDEANAATVSTSVRHVTLLRQATPISLRSLMQSIQPERDANNVVFLSHMTQKQGFMAQLAEEHNGADDVQCDFDGQVYRIGGWTPCSVAAVAPLELARWALLPIVRACNEEACLRFVNVACFSQQGFVSSLRTLIRDVANEAKPVPLEVREAAGDDAHIRQLLRKGDGPLGRICVVSSNAELPGDAMVEMLVNMMRYATRGDTATYERHLRNKLRRTNDYYVSKGMLDEALSEEKQDVSDMIVIETLQW